MKRCLILLVLPMLLACSALGIPLPPTSTSDPGLPTFSPPTVIPTTSVPTVIPETDTPLPPANVLAFPNPDNYTWELIVSDLYRPVDLQPDGSERLFVIEKNGRIRIIENGQLVQTPFLSIEDRVNDGSNEMGLLGLAFHPNYEQNGYFFVNYTGSGGDTFISRFQVSGDPNLANSSSEENLLSINPVHCNLDPMVIFMQVWEMVVRQATRWVTGRKQTLC